MKVGNCAIVIPGAHAPERVAAEALREEVEIRAGVGWPIVDAWPDDRPAVAVSLSRNKTLLGKPVPRRTGSAPENVAEGFRVVVDRKAQIIWVIGADRRGCLYGVGLLLRKLQFTRDSVVLEEDLDIASSPRYPIRGHQLGYRPTANSYDAWTPDQYERYIRAVSYTHLTLPTKA